MKLKKVILVFFELLPFANLGIEKKSTILIDKHIVGGTVFHKHIF